MVVSGKLMSDKLRVAKDSAKISSANLQQDQISLNKINHSSAQHTKLKKAKIN